MRQKVETCCGTVVGQSLRGGGVLTFKGIPFANPPVGGGRWRQPKPVAPWADIRDCTSFGAIPIQHVRHGGPSLFPNDPCPTSEDCLYLNVWTGTKDASARRPVIVWFHPGAFQFGSGSAPLYDGTAWAEAGAVFVTFNYRMSQLGFLAHPELDEESDEGLSGNYGLLDQVAVLRWIRDNIAAFGGNPDCVTLYGISSGASAISLLMGSPLAKGLFHRVIAESGGSFGPLGQTTGAGDVWQTQTAAAQSGVSWAKRAGASSLADLRAMSADDILAASTRLSNDVLGVFDVARPVVDGRILPDRSFALFRRSAQAGIPLMVGSAANEGIATITFPRDLANFLRQARSTHSATLDRYLALYPARTDEEATVAGLRANGDRLFTWQNWTWARLHAAAGHPVYFYRFEQAPPVPPGRYPQQTIPRPLGAFHGASIFYSFASFDCQPDWPWSEADRRLSVMMRNSFVAFARDGRPGGDLGADWTQFNAADAKVKVIAADAAISDVPDQDVLAFWDQFYGVQGL